MTNLFEELAKGLAQSAMRMMVYPGLVALLAKPADANDFRLGPVIDLSDPDALVACITTGNEKECSLAVNPANPKNIVVAWIGGSYRAIGSAVSLDGNSWVTPL